MSTNVCANGSLLRIGFPGGKWAVGKRWWDVLNTGNRFERTGKRCTSDGASPPRSTSRRAANRGLLRRGFVFLRGSADKSAGDADAVRYDQIEAVTVSMRPDGADAMPNWLLAFFGIGDDVGEVRGFRHYDLPFVTGAGLHRFMPTEFGPACRQCWIARCAGNGKDLSSLCQRNERSFWRWVDGVKAGLNTLPERVKLRQD
jgi:hypothetical protein